MEKAQETEKSEEIKQLSESDETLEGVKTEEVKDVEDVKDVEIKEKSQEEPIELLKEDSDKEVIYVPEDSMYVFECPHCNLLVQVKEKDLRCKIFRHAVYKANNKPIKPHAPQAECERLLAQDLVYGCAKPFRLVTTGKVLRAEICGYI